MMLDGVLSQAASGLASIQAKLSTVSQNIANASTPGYVRETLDVQSATAGGIGDGVRIGVATRTVDAALQNEVFASGAGVAEGQARQATLSAIDQASGAPGSGQDLASLLGALRDAFSTLATDPSNETQQRQVVNQANTLANGINTLGKTVTTQRQSVQESLQADVTAANAALATVGQLSDQIIAAQARGESVADLADRRDAAAASVTELTGAKFVVQGNGDLLAVSGGSVLSTHETTGPLGLGTATMAPGSTGPKLTIDGVPASLGFLAADTSIFGGGKIGAELDLRDRVLPGVQSALDGFAQSLATGFAGGGLTLFTDNSGVAIPPAGTAGFAQSIQVSASVQATPSQVRDGSAAPAAAGNTTLINRLLDGALATGPNTIAGQAAGLVAANATAASTSGTTLATNQALQASLQKKLDAQTGVSVDSEMSSMIALQNSYGANAKVIAAVQAMWNQLLATVQ